MTTRYKVWICVERIDEDKDEYKDIEQLSCGGFQRQQKALGLASKLHELSVQILATTHSQRHSR